MPSGHSKYILNYRQCLETNVLAAFYFKHVIHQSKTTTTQVGYKKPQTRLWDVV